MSWANKFPSDVVQARAASGVAILTGDKPITQIARCIEELQNAVIVDVVPKWNSQEKTLSIDCTAGNDETFYHTVTIDTGEDVDLSPIIARLDAVETETNNLETSVTEIQGNITALEGDVLGLYNLMTTLQGQMVALENTVNTFNSRISSIESKYSSLLTRIVNAEGKINFSVKTVSWQSPNIVAEKWGGSSDFIEFTECG